MSHLLKLCTVKELKTVYGIPYSRQHIWRRDEEGTFPHRVILGQCRVAYRCVEIGREPRGPTRGSFFPSDGLRVAPLLALRVLYPYPVPLG
jgi:predicted DNA-binding transcriptional regulator AlpA